MQMFLLLWRVNHIPKVKLRGGQGSLKVSSGFGSSRALEFCWHWKPFLTSTTP